MPTVTMPQLGESVTEGTILRWLKQPGDAVALDDPLCEIETEKVTAELPSPFAGTMGAIRVPEGETVAVGAALCDVGEAAADPVRAAAAERETLVAAQAGWKGGPMAIPPDEAPLPAAPMATSGPAAAPPSPAPRPAQNGAAAEVPPERFYSPVALRLAAQHGLDLSALAGTGLGGRVTKRDIERYLAARAATPSAPTPAPATAPPAAARGDSTVIALSPTRRAIARHLTRSNLEAPQAWTMIEADLTALVALRDSERAGIEARTGTRLTLLPYFAEAVCAALREHPILNARWHGDELRQYRDVHLGIAVATEHGLVVPVVRSANALGVEGLSRAISELATRARGRELRIDDVEGGTITVNNTGAFGSIASRPIVNHPEIAIVTLERVVRRPVVVEGDAIAIRSMANVCLTFDHRALDGSEAGAFLASVKAALEKG